MIRNTRKFNKACKLVFPNLGKHTPSDKFWKDMRRLG